MIQNYEDFIAALQSAGFSMGGGNSEGIYSVISWSWNEEPPYDTAVRWHTGDPQTDPWEWRMRVLDERDDVVYAKIFFKKSGFITKEWYPYFLAARRKGLTLDDAYADGTVSNDAKRIYDMVAQNGTLPLHTIKQLAGFSQENKSAFDRALTELQMRLYLTMCGRQQKRSLKGEEYGWSSTVFCTTEQFFGEVVFAKAATIGEQEAKQRISEQILRLNPEASQKKIKRFIEG